MSEGERSMGWRRATSARLAGFLLAAVVAVGVPASAGAAPRVRLTSPPDGQPTFGKVELAAEVSSATPVQWVDFYVDGQRAGRVERAPWRLPFDLGESNSEHHFRVVAADILGATGEHAAQTPNIPVDMTMEVELQQLFVSVRNRAGAPVAGLTQSDFDIVNEGRNESIATFGGGDLPISSVLLLDSSESMQGEPLQAALEGVRSFVGRTKPEDETMVAFFSDRLLGATTFTRDDSALGRALGDVTASGGTAVNDHFYYALNRLQPRLGRRVVVLLSDGLDVSSFLDMEQVLWRARRSQAMVYWLRMAGSGDGAREPRFASSWRDGEASLRQYKMLEQAVVESGGRILEIHAVAEIDPAFRRVIDEIRNQYVIGFHPREARNDGSWRPLRVVVRGGYDVRTRAGYID
jgi:Ca-activated chloride channel family protein